MLGLFVGYLDRRVKRFNESLKIAHGEDFLNKYLDYWHQYKIVLKNYNNIFKSLNNVNFIKLPNSTYTWGFGILKKELIDPLKQRLFDEIVALINRKRDGQAINLDTIRDAIKIFETTSYAAQIKIKKNPQGHVYAPRDAPTPEKPTPLEYYSENFEEP